MTPLLARRPAADRSFERLYRRHVGDVYHYALAVLRNRDDAEDVTQTTFLNAYRAYQRGDRPETPKNWLIAIAHNVCRQRFRQAQRRPQELPLFEDAAETAVAEPELEHTIEDVRRALSHLAFNQKTALVMRELEGRSYAEIAEIMGLTVGAVETLIFRGRRALREQLEGTLTCAAAELALSKQADGVLSRTERGQLRAHLRECDECATLARRSRATRGALKTIALVPLPSSLASFFGGGSAVATGIAAKAAVAVCAGAVVGGVAYEGSKQLDRTPAAVERPALVAPVRASAAVERLVPVAPVVRRTRAGAADETDGERAANRVRRATVGPNAAIVRPALRRATPPSLRRSPRAAIALAHAPGQARRNANAAARAATPSASSRRRDRVPPGAAVAQARRSARAQPAPPTFPARPKATSAAPAGRLPAAPRAAKAAAPAARPNPAGPSYQSGPTPPAHARADHSNGQSQQQSSAAPPAVTADPTVTVAAMTAAPAMTAATGNRQRNFQGPPGQGPKREK